MASSSVANGERGRVDDAELLAELLLPLGGACVRLLGHRHRQRRIRLALHQDRRDLPEAEVAGDDDGAALLLLQREMCSCPTVIASTGTGWPGCRQYMLVIACA